MTILSPALSSVNPAARVLFDATTFHNPAPAFAAGLLPLTTEEIGQALDDHFGPYVLPVESCKTIEEWEAIEEASRRPSPRDFDLSSMAWKPRVIGYTAQDLADFAAGRTIAAAEMEARLEVEEEARVLASMPAEAHEEMLRECEWARPFEAPGDEPGARATTLPMHTPDGLTARTNDA